MLPSVGGGIKCCTPSVSVCPASTKFCSWVIRCFFHKRTESWPEFNSFRNNIDNIIMFDDVRRLWCGLITMRVRTDCWIVVGDRSQLRDRQRPGGEQADHLLQRRVLWAERLRASWRHAEAVHMRLPTRTSDVIVLDPSHQERSWRLRGAAGRGSVLQERRYANSHYCRHPRYHGLSHVYQYSNCVFIIIGFILVNIHRVSKMHQIWNGIAQNCKDRFCWHLAKIFKRL